MIRFDFCCKVIVLKVCKKLSSSWQIVVRMSSSTALVSDQETYNWILNSNQQEDRSLR